MVMIIMMMIVKMIMIKQNDDDNDEIDCPGCHGNYVITSAMKSAEPLLHIHAVIKSNGNIIAVVITYLLSVMCLD